jgi:glycosyltransferase involved in cell wall biosynthesis
MRIAIAAPSPVPFVIGGAENLWWGLLDALNARPGIQAELLKLPSPERNMGELLTSYRQFSQLELDHFDMVISTKYPAWAIRHRHHVVYLQHTLRGLYDCYPPDLPTHFDPDALLSLGMPARIVDALSRRDATDLELDELLDALDAAWRRSPQSPCWAFPGAVTRAAIRLLDAIAMRPDRIVHYAAISQVVATREGYFPTGVNVAVHHHPTSLKGLAPGPQQTLFSASRLDPAKRIDLIIEAYRQSKVDMPLHIAGSGPDEARLRAAAAGHSGIRFLGRVTDAVLAQEYARAVCVPFVPRDEDYGLITLEAMLAAKPVITTTDSGGPLELIKHQRSGLIVEPDVAALADAMHRVCADLPNALDMGLAARTSVAHLNWDALCDALLAAGRQPSPDNHKDKAAAVKAAAPGIVLRRAKPILGVLNTYPIAPVISGGKLRLHGLYKRVAEQFEVQFINLAPSHMQGVHNLAADFSEELVPKSKAFAEAEQQLENTLGASVEDLVAALHPAATPQWLDAIDALARRADLIVCSHPYAMPALRKVTSDAFVYEAHNVEADLKADIYGSHRWAVDQVLTLERRAVLDSILVTACSQRDRERMGELYGPQEADAKLIVVPNGIDVVATPFRSAAQIQSRRSALRVAHPLALFMGSAHGPNIDAARVIIEAAARLPSVHFLLLGSICYSVQTWERPANVGLLGVVSDAEKATWLAICDLGLNPVISGSGTNLKLLEYAAVGLPVVSTEFGARGCGYCAGRDYVCAEADAFAAGIEAMLQLTQADRDSMARNARRRVEAEGDWTAIASAYSKSLAQILA